MNLLSDPLANPLQSAAAVFTTMNLLLILSVFVLKHHKKLRARIVEYYALAVGLPIALFLYRCILPLLLESGEVSFDVPAARDFLLLGVVLIAVASLQLVLCEKGWRSLKILVYSSSVLGMTGAVYLVSAIDYGGMRWSTGSIASFSIWFVSAAILIGGGCTYVAGPSRHTRWRDE